MGRKQFAFFTVVILAIGIVPPAPACHVPDYLKL